METQTTTAEAAISKPVQTQEVLIGSIVEICNRTYRKIPTRDSLMAEAEAKLASLMSRTNLDPDVLIKNTMDYLENEIKGALNGFYAKQIISAKSKLDELNKDHLKKDGRLDLNIDVQNAINSNLNKIAENNKKQLNFISGLLVSTKAHLISNFNKISNAWQAENDRQAVLKQEEKDRLEALEQQNLIEINNILVDVGSKEESHRLQLEIMNNEHIVSDVLISSAVNFKNYLFLENPVVTTNSDYNLVLENKIGVKDLSIDFNQDNKYYKFSISEYLIHVAGQMGFFQPALEILEAMILKIDAHDNLFEKSDFVAFKNLLLVKNEIDKIFRETVGKKFLDSKWYNIIVTLDNNHTIKKLSVAADQEHNISSLKEFMDKLQKSESEGVFEYLTIQGDILHFYESLDKLMKKYPFSFDLDEDLFELPSPTTVEEKKELVESNPSFFDPKEDFVGLKGEQKALGLEPASGQLKIEKQKHPLEKIYRDIQDLFIQAFNEIDPEKADQYLIVLVPEEVNNKIALIEVITPDNTEHYHEPTQLLDYLNNMINSINSNESKKILELRENIKKIVNENQEYFSLRF